MPKVVAFMDAETCRTFPTVEAAMNAGAVATFSSASEMSRLFTLRDMDRVRARLLEISVPDSTSREEAAKLLWYLLLNREYIDEPWVKKEVPDVRRDVFGNKVINEDRIELIELLYSPGADLMFDLFYTKLYRIYRVVLDLMVADGSRVWSMESVLRLLEANPSIVRTSMELRAVLAQTTKVLLRRRFWARLSFADFSAKPRYRGLFVR